MEDLISRQWLFDRFNEIEMLETYNDYKKVNTVLNEAPKIEATPIVFARWILRDEQKGTGVCSVCNRQDAIDPLATHCRYCGARIEAKESTSNIICN